MKVTHNKYKDLVWEVVRSTSKMHFCRLKSETPHQDFATGKVYTQTTYTNRRLMKTECTIVKEEPNED